MEINDNRGGDDEERRIRQSREQNRVAQERKRAAEPMRTFESKLSEKASHEAGLRESQARENLKRQKDAEERESLIDKIIGAAKEGEEEAAAADKARVSGLKSADEHEAFRRESEHEEGIVRRGDDVDDLDDFAEKKSAVQDGKKKSEVSEEGYRRVAEKQDDGDAGSFGGSTGGETGQGGQDSGGSSAGGGAGGFGGRNPKDEVFAKDLAARALLHPIRKGSDTGRGFQQNPRPFQPGDLDGIVSKVEVGLDAGGEEFFGVELSDRYFDGLKLKAVRTEQGVVVKFLCPNVSVRSTFLKYRPAVIARLKEKGIAVLRVDVA